MNKLLVALLISLFVVSINAYADQREIHSGGGQQQESTPEVNQKMKSNILEMHRKQIQILQQGQSCVQSVTTLAQLKSCHEQEKEAMREHLAFQEKSR